MSERVDAIVIGAGVVGLAVARELARQGLEVVVLESQSAIGSQTSSRNSGVIHAGIYYPTDSLKARLCVEGSRKLYNYCRSRPIPYQAVGKLIVATSPTELEPLERLHHQAMANGVDTLEPLTQAQLKQRESQVNGIAALYSPTTGIIDAQALMLSYLGDLEKHGGLLALHTPVESVRLDNQDFQVRTGGPQEMTLNARLLINSAGLGAVDLLQRMDPFPEGLIPSFYRAKGNYFGYRGTSPFRHLIYPIPGTAGLGIHATLDLGGQVRFGPDVEWVNEAGYQVDPDRREAFYRAIQRYYPGINRQRLFPDYAGIRPKLQAQGSPAQDFRIQTVDDHGIAGLVNLLGIESPGLTASLAIAAQVADRLGIG